MATVVTTATNLFKVPIAKSIMFITIPSYETLTNAQRANVDAGGEYPVIVEDYRSEHLSLVDFLIERSLEAWARSKG